MKKKLEVLQELPKCDTETGVSKYCWENCADRFVPYSVATNLLIVKDAISANHNKAKSNDTLCLYSHSHLGKIIQAEKARRAAPVKAFQGSSFQVYREEMEGLLGI